VDAEVTDDRDAEAHDLSEAGVVLNALSSAWSTFRLYPNPRSQSAFVQAVATIRALERVLPLTFDIGVAGLAVRGQALTGLHAGAEQLAKRLYLHAVEAVTLEAPPTDSEVINLFRLLSLDEDEAQARGGLAALCEDPAFLIHERRTLEEELEQDGKGEGRGGPTMPDRTSELAALVDGGADASRVVEHLMSQSAGDVDEMSQRYVEGFKEIHDLTDATGAPDAPLSEMFLPYLVDDIGSSPTGTFVEVFFRLPDGARSRIFTSFLADSTAAPARLFLDQFSGEELLALAEFLDPASYDTLMAYAADAAEVDATHEAALAPLLGSAREVRDARQATGLYVARLLNAIDTGVASQSLADEIRTLLKPEAVEGHGRAVLRGLFAIVQRPDRVRRLARIWAARVGWHLGNGDYERAIAEVDAVQRDVKYDPDHNEAIGDALGRIINAGFVTSLAEAADREDQIKFLRALGTPATSRLIELLADEEDAANRRSLLDLLAVLCRSNPRPLIAALGDERWFVVRNVAMILGKTGHTSAVRHLKRQLDHPDARVRVEVLRALMPLAKEESVGILVDALGDANKRVRYAAVSMLKSAEDAGVDDDLAAVIAGNKVPEAVMLSVVEALAGRDTPQARTTLESIAGRRLSVNRSSRAIRNAAKAALAGWHE
jgi:hypothetical protein